MKLNMLIRDLTPQECRDMLTRIGFGRLACARDNQPYIVPIYFAYEFDLLYGFTTVGRKIEWMRTNPKVCLEVDEVLSHFKWMSVIVMGRYEELPNTPEFRRKREHALVALEKRMFWWRTALAAKQLPTRHKDAEPLFYCIHIDSMTGHRALPDAVKSKLGRAHKERTT
jgi:uncharacterized protein